MDSLILDLQIVFYFQLFLSANVRHTSSAKNNIVLSCWRLRIYMVAVSVICVMQFQYQKTNSICAKNKEA